MVIQLVWRAVVSSVNNGFSWIWTKIRSKHVVYDPESLGTPFKNATPPPPPSAPTSSFDDNNNNEPTSVNEETSNGAPEAIESTVEEDADMRQLADFIAN